MPRLKKQYFWVNQLRRDFLVDFSYKISFFGQFFGIVLTSISFFFISKTFPMTNSIHLADFNYDYFMFATIGIAIIDMVISIMRSLTISLREAQTFGYDEILFISSVSPTYIFFCSSIYTFIKGTFKFIFYIFLLQLLGDYSFSITSILIVFFLFFVMVIPFLGLSFFGLSFVLFYKQADPVNFIINTVLSIFSGIIYPVSVLPTFMQTISDFIPLTSQLNSARHILLNDSLDNYISSNLFYLHILFSLFFLFCSMQVFKIVVSLVKIRGTLGTY